MRLGIIGTGHMGRSLLVPLCREQTVFACNRGREKLQAVCRETGAVACDSPQQVLERAELVILAVKPADMPALLEQLRPHGQIFLSVAARLPLAFYREALGPEAKLARMMPNTPALVGEGVLAICFDASVPPQARQAVCRTLSVCGLVQELPEAQLDAVTALTGSSPAYLYVMIEAMADAAVRDGLDRALAYRLAAQAVCGAGKMVLQTGLLPAELKDQVCSPGGTTIRALAELERCGFRSAIIEAMGVCTEAAKG